MGAARFALLTCATLLRAAGVGVLSPVGLSEWEATYAPDFHKFMDKYRRTFAHGSREYRERLALFARRVADVQAQNARPGRLWTAGINELSDRTEAELAQLRGWRGVALRAGSRAAPGSSAAFLSQRGPAKAALPVEFLSWHKLDAVSSVANQGGCGSCWAVATAKTLQLHREIYHPNATRTFSAQQLVSCVANPFRCGGTGGCEGATAELAFDWAMQHGLAEEREVPYFEMDTRCRFQAPSSNNFMQTRPGNADALAELVEPGVHMASTGDAGPNIGLLGWERLPENSYEALLRAVVERGPVAISVGASAWSSYSSGIFDSCEKNAIIDHAVVLVGFGKDADTGKLFYLILNSWGLSWGESGTMRLLRHQNEEDHCGIDNQPELGTGCKGGPSEVKVCGACGILYDNVVPYFKL